MILILPTNKSSFNITVTVQTSSAQEICIVGKDTNKPSTFYFRRKGVVDGKRKFTLRFPMSPLQMELKIYNGANECTPRDEDKTFKVIDLKFAPIQTNDVWMNAETIEFVKFAKQFSDNASILSLGEYRSDNGVYKIHYLDVIRENGKETTNPARIGHESGIIELSKRDFFHYSVPMRMIILLHEYSHKYMNNIVDREIDDETSADINALYIYLGLGFPRIEATNAFLNVFLDAANKTNNKRYKIINDFITKFDQGKFTVS